MNRTTLIVITVILGIAVVIIGVMLFRTELTNVNNTNETGTNTANTNGSTVLNTLPVNQKATFHGADVPIERVERATSVAGFTPKKGEVFLIVYLEKILPEFDTPIAQWLPIDVELTDKGGNRYGIAFANVADPASDQQPYFAFRVSEAAEDFTLRFVRAEEDVKIDLGL